MINIDTLKGKVDCRTVIERDLGKPRFRAQDYSAFKCPLHGEQKGYSLVVYADHWHCYGKCQKAGDVIAWVQHFHKLSFQEACIRLGSGDLPQSPPRPMRLPESISQPSDERWQHAARRIVEKAQEQLWALEGERALAYLRWGRGLNDDIITAARLGYVPGAPSAWETIEGVSVPCGIGPWCLPLV